ncbi:hypothetical protein TWF106_003777 [Orbilia oligospora]|nr:hypothetical protein TWF788_006011 [Orbilia oligospora]KAF3199544.1 hypothetical protein TWF106_003777 [Orbilia oligospora]KAF3246635.1 hypothetical protein TWF192_006790 [Orbilia oligospora]
MFLTYSSGDEEEEDEYVPPPSKKRKAPESEPNKAPAQELISEMRSKRQRISEREADGEGGEGTKVQRTFFAAAREEAREVTENVQRARGSFQKPAALAPVLPSLRAKLLDDSNKPKKSSVTFFSCNSEAYKASSHDFRPRSSQHYVIETRKNKHKPKFSSDWATYRR